MVGIVLGEVHLGCERPRPNTTEIALAPEPSLSRAGELPEPAPAPLLASERWFMIEAELKASLGGARLSDGAKAELRTRALGALDALPDADPWTVELLCRAALEPWFASERRGALLARAAELAATLRAEEAQGRYASLLRDTIRLYNHYWFPSNGKPLGQSLKVKRIERRWREVDERDLTDEDCAAADWAALRIASIKQDRRMSRSSYEALYDEVERALGAEHPALATVLDHALGVCDQDTPSPSCVAESDRHRFARALDLRERGLGHDHPLTHASRLNLAIILQEQGDHRRSEA